MRAKENEKVEKYQDLAREVRKMWGVRTKVIPIVVGALGTLIIATEVKRKSEDHRCFFFIEFSIYLDIRYVY